MLPSPVGGTRRWRPLLATGRAAAPATAPWGRGICATQTATARADDAAATRGATVAAAWTTSGCRTAAGPDDAAASSDNAATRSDDAAAALRSPVSDLCMTAVAQWQAAVASARARPTTTLKRGTGTARQHEHAQNSVTASRNHLVLLGNRKAKRRSGAQAIIRENRGFLVPRLRSSQTAVRLRGLGLALNGR